MAMSRPNVFQWLWFAFGGRLPTRYREWVLQDAVSRAWLLRFTVRALVRIAPLVLAALLVLWLVDAHFGIALAAVVLGCTVGIYYSMSYAPERVDQQLRAYGYPPGTADRMRQERAGSKNERERARYERTWRRPGDTV
jgi:hypothetical protein